MFLGAGAVIHSVADNQDFRKYGGLISHLPLNYSVMLIASLSLVALPFMTGFYSKDFILESSFGYFDYSSITIYVIAVIGAIFTTLYSTKVLHLTFLTNPNGPIVSYKNTPESDLYMSWPLVILAIFSILFGYMTKDIFVGLGTNFFFMDNSIFIHPIHEIAINTEFGTPTLFKLLPLYCTILFSILALLISEYLPEIWINLKLSRLGYIIFGFLNQRFSVEYIYNKFITKKVLDFGKQTTSILDIGSVELIGPKGLERMLIHSSKSIVSLSTGVVTNYALYILIGFGLYTLILVVQALNINNILYSMNGFKGSIGAMITIMVLILIPSIINIFGVKNQDVKTEIIINNYESSKLSSKQLLESKFFLISTAAIKGSYSYSYLVPVLPQITICIHLKTIIEEIHKFLIIEFLYYFSCFVFYVYDFDPPTPYYFFNKKIIGVGGSYFVFFVLYINGIYLLRIIQFSSPSGPKRYVTSP